MRPAPLPLLLLLCLACALPAALPEAQADDHRSATPDSPPRLTLGDTFGLEWASDPRLHPDGRRLVYQRNSMDRMADRRVSQLWLASTDGSSHQPLTDGNGSHSQARWSPDGTRLAWISGTAQGAEIFVHWTDSGRTARITQLDHSPGGLAWSPDSRWLAFTMHVPAANAPGNLLMPAAPEGAQWAAPAKVIREVRYRSDGAGFLPDGHTQVFVVPADGGTPRQVTHGDFNHGGTPAWLPDGSGLLVSANRNADWAREAVRSQLHHVDLASGNMTTVFRHDGTAFAPAVSPDGSRVAWRGNLDDGRSWQPGNLYLADLGDLLDGTAEPDVLTADLDRNLTDHHWAGDSRALLISYDDQGMGRVDRLRLNGRRDRLVDDLGGTALSRPYSRGDLHAVGDALAWTSGSASRPAELKTMRRGRDPRTLTRLNEDLLGHRSLARVEELAVTAPDGLTVPAWLAIPPGDAPPGGWPLLLEIHGGPHTAYGPHFSMEVQLFAAYGYAVLYTNPRGSTSYGSDFALAIDKNYPGPDLQDLLAAVDAALASGRIDANNLFVTGGSGGGTLTAWIVGSTNRFTAAVAAKPVINWLSFTLTADGYTYFANYWFDQFPWEDPMGHWQRSPLSLVGNVQTPTMVLTGEEDWRTPMSESEQYFQALQLRGVDTALVRIPGAGHSIANRPSQLMAKVANILHWFDTHRAAPNDPDGAPTTSTGQ